MHTDFRSTDHGGGKRARSLKSVAWQADTRRFADPDEFTRESRNAHAQAFSGKNQSFICEDVLSAWDRSTAAGITPDLPQPENVLAASELYDTRTANPLAPIAQDVVASLADESAAGRHLVILSDSTGKVLWRAGSPWALRRGDRIALAEGADWSESGFGTNAISEAVVTNSAINMMSGEHYVRALHEWFCTASPIRDNTGRLLGILDISIPSRFASSELRTLVKSGVRLAETMLKLNPMRIAGPEPGGLDTCTSQQLSHIPTGEAALPFTTIGTFPPPGSPAVTTAPATASPDNAYEPADSDISMIRLLSYRPEVVYADGRRIPLTHRRAELLALLASREAWSAQALAFALYGDDGSPSTVRGEIRRLKQSTRLDIASNPYALSPANRAVVDFLAPGAERIRLLPESEVPAVAELRW